MIVSKGKIDYISVKDGPDGQDQQIYIIYCMSTYFPKTFKKWKVQKKCLSCSQEPLKYIQKASIKQLAIHSIAIDKQINNSPQPKPFSQIFQIESPSLKKPSTPSGGRKKKNSPAKSNFHRTSWEDIRLQPKGSVKQIYKQEKGISNINMFRMITKKRPIVEMKKRLTERSALEDLIKLVTPSKKYENQILQTDQQRKSVRVLEKDQFIPYRVKNKDKNTKFQPQTAQSNFITSPRIHQKKQYLKSCDFSEAMTRIPIGKSLRYKSQKKMGSKLRSFSVVQLQSSEDYIKNRGNSHINVCTSMQIQPWQQTQRHH